MKEMKETANNLKNEVMNAADTEGMKREVAKIKEDLQDIGRRMGNLKGMSMDVLSEEMGNLMTSVYDMKDKCMSQSYEAMKCMSWYVQKNPIKSLMWGISGGVLLSILLRK